MTNRERFYAEALSYTPAIGSKKGIKTEPEVRPNLPVAGRHCFRGSFHISYIIFISTGYAQTNETSVYWFMKGYDLCKQERYNESLEAYNKLS